MTTLVQQKSGNDCVLAAVAMALGKTWEELWTQEDLNTAIEKKGLNTGDYLERAGLVREQDYRSVYLNGVDMQAVYRLLWKRRAVLSVHSLNNEGGSHAVYWDGEKLWDPHEGHYPEHLAFRHLTSCHITYVYLLP